MLVLSSDLTMKRGGGGVGREKSGRGGEEAPRNLEHLSLPLNFSKGNYYLHYKNILEGSSLKPHLTILDYFF